MRASQVMYVSSRTPSGVRVRAASIIDATMRRHLGAHGGRRRRDRPCRGHRPGDSSVPGRVASWAIRA